MRKGLTTLLTVAIAIFGSQAMAMAPIIGDIPSPIVGGSTGVSQTTKFVYPDAFDLNLLVSDDQTTPTSLLKWTYEQVGSTYLINGIKSIVSSATDPITIGDSATINRAAARGYGFTASSGTQETPTVATTPMNRVTIRNDRLAPLNRSGYVTPSPSVGFQDIVPITFWCSDGNAATSSTVLFYTDNYANGFNRLSQTTKSWTFENKEVFFNKCWAVSEGFYGACTTHTWPASGTGVCFEVAKTGNNWGSVASPLGFLTLSPNTLYRVRAKMNCSQVAPGHTPFWDMVVENNYDAVLKKGLNLYSMDQIFLDNVGGANSVVSSTNGTDLTMYFAPSAVSTPQLNDAKAGLFSTTYSANKDARVRFRVLDVDSNTALLNDQKYGAICLQQIQIDSIPISKITTTPIYTISSFKRNTDTTNTSLNNTEVSGYVGPSIVFNSGTLTITPNGSGTSSELITITPANDTDKAGGVAPVFTAPYTNMSDEWPIPWVANRVYELDVTLVAPTSNDQSHPWDAMWMGFDCPTNEVNCETVITSVKAIASPRTSASVYKMWYCAQNETAMSNAAFHVLRWRIRFGNNTSLNFPSASDTTNVGAVRLTNLKVSTVTFPAQ